MAFTYKYLFFIISLLLILPLVSSLNVNVETPINYSTLNVNNSQYFDGYTPTTLWNSYTILGNAIWCKLTGCDMTGDLTTTGNITADTYFGDGSQLTGIDSVWEVSGSDIYYNDGNVGIGTSNPTFPNRDSKLVIEGSGTGTTGRTAFVVRNTATDSAASFILANSDENSMSAQVSGSSYVGGEKAGFSTTGLNLSFGVDGNMRDGGTHTISFTTGGWANNPTMTITPGNPGAVGIGTTSAVYNNGGAERSIQIHALKKGSPGGLSYGAETIDDTYGPDFSFLRQRAGNTKVEDGDRIGSLNAYGYVGSYYRYMGGINIEVDGATITDQRAPSRIIFKTGELDTSAVEVMRIDSSGNVGIGTTSPTEKLEVNGNLFLNGDNVKFMLGTAKDSSIYYDGTDLIINPKEVGNGQVNITNHLEVNGNITSDEYILGKNQVTQLHNNITIIQNSIDTWKNISWNLKIDDETTTGYTLLDDNESIQFNYNGIVRVQGCLHPYNNNIGNQEAKILVRTLINNVEARCLQVSKTKSFKSSGIDILEYVGTVKVENGQKVQIQWRVDNTNIELRGDTDFDNPVSASVNLERISN